MEGGAALLGVGEDEDGGPRALGEQVAQRDEFAGLAAHKQQPLLNAGGRGVALADCHAHWLPQHAARQLFHLLR